MNELYDSVDMNKLKWEYANKKNKEVSFYEYTDSKELFNKLKDNHISFSDAQKKQEDFLKKLNKVKIGNKNNEQKKVIDNLYKFYHSKEEVLNFPKIILKCSLMLVTKQNRTKQ